MRECNVNAFFTGGVLSFATLCLLTGHIAVGIVLGILGVAGVKMALETPPDKKVLGLRDLNNLTSRKNKKK